MPGHPFYGSVEWKRARSIAVKRAHGRCELCRCPVNRKGAARVDHKIPRAERPDLALDPENLRVLCVACDAIRHADKGRRAPYLGSSDVQGLPTDPEHPWNRGAVRRRPGGG